MNFWRAIEILGKRKWLILFSIIVSMAMTWGATRLAGAKWTAVVRFVALSTPGLSDPNRANAITDDTGQVNAEARQSSVAQAVIYSALIKSSDVVIPTLEKLNEKQPRINFGKDVLFTMTTPRMYELQVSHTSPQVAERYANALADNFLLSSRKINTSQASRAVEVLADQVKKMDTRLADTRRRFDAYKSQRQIINPSSAVNAPNTALDLAITQWKTAKAQQEDTSQQIAQIQAKLAQKQGVMDALPPTIAQAQAPPPNITLQELKLELKQADLNYKKLSSRFTETNPDVRKAKTERDRAMAAVQEEERKPPVATEIQVVNPAVAKTKSDIDDLRMNLAGLQAQQAKLTQAIASSQAQIDRFKGVDGTMSAFANELMELTTQRASLTNRLYNAQLALDALERHNPLAILDRVSEFNPPINTTQGRTWKLMLLAGLSALLAVSAIIIAFDSIDRRLKSVPEAELALPTRILAAIPQPTGSVTYATLARATELYPRSLQSESYRFLGMHLLTAQGEDAPRSLMALSAKAEQGSTTTITNLGITLAQAGKRVVIVDANIRTSELHQVFEIQNKFGFIDLLKNPDVDSLEKALQPTTIPNLYLITSGSLPENPWELFRSPNLVALSKHLLEFADYVLYDTPSSLIFTDALNLTPVVDAAFLCVRALEPLTGAEERVIEQFESAGVQVLGTVLNDVPASVVEGFRNYQHYYQPTLSGSTMAIGPSAGTRNGTNGVGASNGHGAGTSGGQTTDGAMATSSRPTVVTIPKEEDRGDEV